MNQIAAVLVTVFLVLYVAMMIVLGLRMRRMNRFEKRNKDAKVFYFSVFTFLGLRVVGLLVLGIGGEGLPEDVAFVLLEVPSAFSIVPFILLGIIKLEKTYEAHMSSHISKTFIANTEKKSRLQGCRPLILGYVLVLLTGFVITLGLFFATVISSAAVDIFLGAFDISVSTAILTLAIILHAKFSGVPTKSEKWTKIMKKINAVTIFWITGRTLRSILIILSFVSLNSETSDMFSKSQSFSNFVFTLIAVFLTEVLNMVLTIDYSFFSIFLQEPQEKQELPKEKQLRRQTVRLSMISMDPYINDEDIQVTEEMPSRANGLGKMYKAQYQNKLIAYRKILTPSVSTYVTEEIQAEVETYKKLCIPGLVRVSAIALNQSAVCFAYQYYDKSLYRFLHVDKVRLDYPTKINILGKIAEILTDIHSEDKVHGHLTSHNVLIDGEELVISDLGFHKLKKYIGIKNGYSYKSAWSSPEILKDGRVTPGNIHSSSDVYSFGMICWEVLTGDEPFPSFSVQEVKKKVVGEGYRPMIPKELNEDLVRLIQSCFNEDFSKRPESHMLAGILNY